MRLRYVSSYSVVNSYTAISNYILSPPTITILSRQGFIEMHSYSAVNSFTLIGEYFSSSLSQRTRSKSNDIKYIKCPLDVLEVLRCALSCLYVDAYDAAVNLLAEINDLDVLKNTINSFIIETTPEIYWEILIKACACAYKTDPQHRLDLISNVILIGPKTYSIKTGIIDALVIIADVIDVETVLMGFNNDDNKYIRDYADEALKEINY